MALLAASVAVAFGVLLYAFSVLITDEAAGAEFSTTTLSVAYGGAVLMAGLLAIPVGRQADRHGVRGLVGAGAVTGAAGLVALAAAQEPWHVVAASWGLIGPAGAMSFYEPAFVAVGQWFGARQRARALALLTVVGGLAGPVFIPTTSGLVSALEWRATALILALVLAGAGTLSAAVLPAQRTPPARREPRDEETAAHLLRNRRFVLYSASVLLMFGALQAVLFHRIASFEELGWSVGLVSLWASASGLLSFAGRFGAPFLGDRYGALRVNWLTLAAVGATVVLMIDATASWQLALHFILFGPAFGAVLPLRAAVMSDWYSGAAYGRIMGLQWTLASVAGAAGPAGVGVLRDATGGYTGPWVLVAAALALATLLAVASGRSGGAVGRPGLSRPGESRPS